MDFFNGINWSEIITNIVIIIVVLIIVQHFVIRSIIKFKGRISEKRKAETNLQKTKYLSWIDRFRDNYEKQIKHIQNFQTNLLKCCLYILVILICRNSIDSDFNSLNSIEKIFFAFSFILVIIMFWNVIKIMLKILSTSREIKDFQERNKISDNGLEVYDKEFFGVTMKNVIGLRKESRNDKYDD